MAQQQKQQSHCCKKNYAQKWKQFCDNLHTLFVKITFQSGQAELTTPFKNMEPAKLAKFTESHFHTSFVRSPVGMDVNPDANMVTGVVIVISNVHKC